MEDIYCPCELCGGEPYKETTQEIAESLRKFVRMRASQVEWCINKLTAFSIEGGSDSNRAAAIAAHARNNLDELRDLRLEEVELWHENRA